MSTFSKINKLYYITFFYTYIQSLKLGFNYNIFFKLQYQLKLLNGDKKWLLNN